MRVRVKQIELVQDLVQKSIEAVPTAVRTLIFSSSL